MSDHPEPTAEHPEPAPSPRTAEGASGPVEMPVEAHAAVARILEFLHRLDEAGRAPNL